MAKSQTVFTCQNCGESYPKWQGQCASCNEWNTLVEQMAPTTGSGKNVPAGQRSKPIDPQNVVTFSEVEASKRPKRRSSTQLGELDRVLGGGMVPGAVMLIGGEPGIGKSTLLTQMVVQVIAAAAVAKKAPPTKETPASGGEFVILYVAGEESPAQIVLRINRILQNEDGVVRKTLGGGGPEALNEHLLFVTSTDVDEVVSVIRDKQPQLVIIDSIQTMQTTDLTGAEGSVGQIRECTQRLTDVAKQLHVPTFLVGHVTKEGTIAGPKVLEHIVDTVLELSGERTGQLRVLRAIKNRFGATDEVGVFKTVEFGLEEVTNPSELFLENADKAVAGSATVCVLEGTRPLLAEVQALVVNSQLAMPRRVGRGIELSRIQVLAAVLQKHGGLPLGVADIFLSAAGGFTIREPAVDLGLAVAMASSLQNLPLPSETLFVGEIGLLGEIRSVSYLDQRIKEAKRLGYTKIISRKTHRYVREVLKELGLLTRRTTSSSHTAPDSL
jgi:DNA repair protein RadA/Sms